MERSSVAKISRNTAMLVLATLSRMALAFAFVIYAASLLGKERFGQYALVTHYFELFLSLCSTAVGIYLTREASKRPRDLPELLSHGFALLLGLLAASGVVLTVVFRLASYSHGTVVAMGVASCALLPAATAAILEATLIALEKAHHVTIATALESGLRFAASFVVLALGYGLPAVFAILIVTRTVQALYYAAQVHQWVPLHWRFRPRRFRVMFRRWRIFAAENWLATIYTSLDVLVLSFFHGEAAVGLYAAATRVVRLGSMAAKSYTLAVFPVLSRLHRTSRTAFEQLSHVTLRYMIAIAVPAALAMAVFAEPIMSLLYSEEYAAAVPVLQVFAWILVLEAINPFLSYTLFAKGAQSASMRVAALGLIVNGIASYFLTRSWGPVGAAWAAIIAGFAATCGYGLASLRRDEITRFLGDAVKVVLASTALAAVLWWSRNSTIAVSLLIGGALYVSLLVILRVIKHSDLRLWRSEL
ncbi:MAG TPA: oligosaccharide flippase family protein [Pirellulaceae bacterium]